MESHGKQRKEPIDEIIELSIRWCRCAGVVATSGPIRIQGQLRPGEWIEDVLRGPWNRSAAGAVAWRLWHRRRLGAIIANLVQDLPGHRRRVGGTRTDGGH